MKIFLKFSVLFLLIFTNCTPKDSKNTEISNTFVQDHYTKKEVNITMRDGAKLHTTIYAPRDASQAYPILLQRTPYSCRPYGDDAFRKNIGSIYTL